MRILPPAAWLQLASRLVTVSIRFTATAGANEFTKVVIVNEGMVNDSQGWRLVNSMLPLNRAKRVLLISNE